ncbi:glycosyltransferase family 4 protein [Methyloglobulus sp.]|uniref:glycosyltransferase family 4 protein n=1 Tax=Methyloglobulus sp. TaxID=2518622 RepID=UPI0032B86002
MKKIVYVPESFPQPSETFVINEIDSLLDIGYQITVVPRVSGYTGEIHHARLDKILTRIEVITENSNLDLSSFFWGLLYGSQVWGGLRLRALIKHFKQALSIAQHVARITVEKPELIIIHFGYDNAVAGALAASYLKIPSILWMHGSDMHTVPHRSLIWISKQVSVVMTNSEYSTGLLNQLGVKNKIEISNLGIDLHSFKPPPIANKQKNPTIICVARLGHHKNHRQLIHVFQRVLKQVHNAELWLVGDGPNREEYEILVSQLDLKQVVFWGMLSQEHIVKLMQQSWIKVLLSAKEGLGVALIEAQASELPCVATQVGGIPEVISDGETGFLFDLNSADFETKVVDAIVKLLNNDDLRKKMGVEARIRAERLFNEKTHTERMDTIIKTLF